MCRALQKALSGKPHHLSKDEMNRVLEGQVGGATTPLTLSHILISLDHIFTYLIVVYLKYSYHLFLYPIYSHTHSQDTTILCSICDGISPIYCMYTTLTLTLTLSCTLTFFATVHVHR